MQYKDVEVEKKKGEEMEKDVAGDILYCISCSYTLYIHREEVKQVSITLYFRILFCTVLRMSSVRYYILLLSTDPLKKRKPMMN